jgi:hypothetical protein
MPYEVDAGRWGCCASLLQPGRGGGVKRRFGAFVGPAAVSKIIL